MALLEIRNLTVSFATRQGAFCAVDGVDIVVDANEVLGVVGESGSGKSVAMLAVMGLLPWTATVTADRMSFAGTDLRSLDARQRRAIVGRDIAMIFQEPMSSLNPCFTVGFQIGESLKTHLGMDKAARRTRSLELLNQVGITDPERRLSAFPHQLSGGMSQRVMIAMALACRPKLLIADEPSTALDVTIQAQILDLLLKLQERDQHGPGAHHPRHGRRRRDRRPCDRPVRRPPGRAQPDAQSFPRPASPLYARPAGGIAGARDRPAAAGDCRRRARANSTARPAACSRRAARLRSIAATIRAHRRRVPRSAMRCAGRRWSGASRLQPRSRHDRRPRSPQSHAAPTRSAAACSRRHPRSRRWSTCRSRSSPARRSRWSANPAPASRPSRA